MSAKREDGAHADLMALEERLGYVFEAPSLLDNALRHSSSAHENPGTTSNERLEFLGDAVMALVVGHLLFQAHPGWEEGDLTRAVQRLVDRVAFAALGRRLGVGSYLRLGRTEQQLGFAAKESILSNAMEAVVGAIYLDGGLEAAMALVGRVYAEELAEGAPRAAGDAKTRFQEAVMAAHGVFPHYELERDSEVEGDQARFTMRALVGDDTWSSGSGRTKQLGEFAAARAGLKRLEEETGQGE